MIPLSLQRRVEALLQEHLDKMELASSREGECLRESKSVEGSEYLNSNEDQNQWHDASVMEKILQRRSLRMLNLQRSWKVSFLILPHYSRI